MGELGRDEPIGSAGSGGPAATVTMLAVGGRRHGEEITLAEGQTTWVDLLSAESYYAEEFKYVRRDPANPRSMSLRTGWRATALVHEDIAADQGLRQQWWMALALERLFLEQGREVPVNEIIGNAPPESLNGRAHD
jgi:hypothetical protein